MHTFFFSPETILSCSILLDSSMLIVFLIYCCLIIQLFLKACLSRHLSVRLEDSLTRYPLLFCLLIFESCYLFRLNSYRGYRYLLELTTLYYRFYFIHAPSNYYHLRHINSCLLFILHVILFCPSPMDSFSYHRHFVLGHDPTQ